MSPTPFEASAARSDGVSVISVQGELDLSTAGALEGPLDEAVDSGDDPVLIDLSDCEFIDSTGIALIVRAWQRSEADGPDPKLAICGCNDQVRRVLEITGLADSIPLYPGRDEALAALRG